MIVFRILNNDQPWMAAARRWLCIALPALLLAATASAADSPALLAKRTFALADKQQFSEVDLLLSSLAENHAHSPERVAAVLYAGERSYAAGNRPQASAWIASLADDAPPSKFRDAIGDALAWCQVNPVDLAVPTARLLELAEQHSSSSFAPVALQLRAEQLASAKRADEAIFVYHQLVGQFPRSRLAPGSLLAVATLHHDLNQHPEAWRYLQQLENEHPQHEKMDAALYLGMQVAQALGQEDTAFERLEKLVSEHKQSPYWADAALRLAERKTAAGDSSAGRALCEQILQDMAPADLASRARFLLLRLAVMDEDWQAVERYSEELQSGVEDASLQTLARFWHAEAAYRHGGQELAYTRFLDLSLAIEGRTDDWLGVVPLRLAQIEAQRQHWSIALEWAELASKQSPRYARRHEVDYLRGRSLMALARFSDAREALGQAALAAAEVDTETAARAQWLIGETWFQQRQYEQAISAYAQTLKCKHPEWCAAALLQSAKCCEQLSRWSDAAQRYEQLVRDHSDTRYAAEATHRLAKTQAKVAAQILTETTTR